MTRSINVSVAVLFAVATGIGYGQVTINLPGEHGVSFGWYSRAASANTSFAEMNFPELDTATSYGLTVTTPDDIQAIDFSIDVIAGSVFNDKLTKNQYGTQLGSDTRRPSTGTPASLGHLGWDSWVSTPGSTQCVEVDGVCPGFENVDDTIVDHVSHVDSSGEGAQTDFNFARITLVPDERGAMAEFTGFVHVANQPSPIMESFSFTLGSIVPEPESMSLLLTAVLGGLFLVRSSRKASVR